MDVLVDALTMRDLAVGLRPKPLSNFSGSTPEVAAYLIAPLEYLNLLDVVAHIARFSHSQPPEILAIEEALDGALTERDWAAWFLDIDMISDVYGTPVQLVTPSADRLRYVIAVREYYRIEERDAVNLLVAEEYAVPFLVQEGLHDANVLDAFRDRGIDVLIAA